MPKRRTRRRIPTRSSTIFCVEKEYGPGDFEIIGCYSHRTDAQKVVSANSKMTLRTKRLVRRVKRR